MSTQPKVDSAIATTVAIPVLIALRRIGPYHHARFDAAHGRSIGALTLTALETRPLSQEYAWDYTPPASYPIERLQGAPHAEADPSIASLDQQIAAILDRHRPRVIVTVGWADRSFQRLVLAARRRRLPLVIVSDSRWSDEPRQPWKEFLKRLMLRSYSAAFVAGVESRAYVERLGFPSEGIYQPWDVIDNKFFANASAMALDKTTEGTGFAKGAVDRPPDAVTPHFLCISRFINKKNLPLLLAAYGAYQRQGGSWGLRIMGGGSMELDLRRIVQSLPEPDRVRLGAFAQLEEIRRCYGQARAFVLASTSDQWGLAVNEAIAAGLPVLVSNACGCRIDLVEHGISGWCFDPDDADSLTALLHRAQRQSACERSAMVEAARTRLAGFSPESFATGLAQAVRWAIIHDRDSRSGALVSHLLSGLSK